MVSHFGRGLVGPNRSIVFPTFARHLGRRQNFLSRSSMDFTRSLTREAKTQTFGPTWAPFGSMFAPLGLHVGSIWVPFWGDFELWERIWVPKWCRNGPRWPQMAPDGPKMPRDDPKMAQHISHAFRPPEWVSGFCIVFIIETIASYLLCWCFSRFWSTCLL